MSAPEIVILPAQASRIFREAAQTGAAIGVSQSGNCLVVDNGRERFTINAGGHDLPNTNQEQLEC